MALSTSSVACGILSSESGLDFIALSLFGHVLAISSLSGVIYPDSFLIRIIFCIFICSLLSHRPFLPSTSNKTTHTLIKQ